MKHSYGKRRCSMSDGGNKADVARQKAAKTRMQNSRKLILSVAERLESSGMDLGTMTMKAFAEEAQVAPNTVTRQFRTVNDVVAALVKQRDDVGAQVSPRLRAQTERQTVNDNREFVHDQLRLLRALGESSVEDAVGRMRQMYAETVRTHPDEHHLLAAQCCHLSYSLLLLPPSAAAVSEAQEVAETGTEHIEADKGRHYALGGQLARNAAAAAQRAAQIACSTVEDDLHDEVAILRAKLAVTRNLTAVATNKAKERRFQIKLNQPLNAAVAEFHRARASALVNEDAAAEANSIVTLALELEHYARDGGTLPPRVLVPLLTRMCGVQVAYDQDPHVEYDRSEFRRLRELLLESLVAQRKSNAETSGRALATMFALADRQRGAIDFDHDVHLPDLILLGGYGVVGQLLIADFLYDLAKVREAQQGSLPSGVSDSVSKPLYEINPYHLLSAAQMYYLEAPKNTLVVGSAAVLAARARTELEEGFNDVEVEDAKPWAVLRNGDLNAQMVNRLSLEVAIGKRPSVNEARAMLRELQPLMLTLRTIAGEEMKPDENGAFETIATAGLRFY